MHILFLTDNFPPEVNAPASRTFEHCRLWVSAGHKVTVITCAPNFPLGRVFSGYRNRLVQREEIEGISVVRVWSYITRNEGTLRRTLDYVSFMFSSMFASIFVRRVDVVVGTSPQFFTTCAAWVVGAVKRKAFVFELRDLWPESIKAVGAMKNERILGMLERIELFLYRHAARVVSVTHSFRRNLQERGIDPGKVEVITNGVDLSRFAPRPRDAALAEKLGLTGKFVAGYVGTHGMAHGLETLLEAARILKSGPDADRFRIVLLGDGARKADLQRLAGEMGLDNVVFVDTVDKAEVPKYWSLLDVSIIHLRKTELFSTVIPSKLFECMGMGLPVLHGVEGESAEIVRRERVGIVFPPEDAVALAAGIRRFRQDPAFAAECRQSATSAAGHYDRTKLGMDMLRVLESVVGRPSTLPPADPAGPVQGG